MDFRRLFADLRKRRRMFLLDDRYMTLVAFVEGCNAATDWRLLDGFGGWISHRILNAESSLHWSTIVASKWAPQVLREPRSERLPAEAESRAADELLELLDEFLRVKESRPSALEES